MVEVVKKKMLGDEMMTEQIEKERKLSSLALEHHIAIKQKFIEEEKELERQKIEEKAKVENIIKENDSETITTSKGNTGEEVSGDTTRDR